MKNKTTPPNTQSASSMRWEELSTRLVNISRDICEMNGCTNDQHNCESYAYVQVDGRCLDICGSDYFQGSSRPHAAIPLPWTGSGDELQNEVLEQCWDHPDFNGDADAQECA